MRSVYIILTLVFAPLHFNCVPAVMASKFNSAVTHFSAKFVNELDKDKSVVSSPLSAKFLLGLITLGSTGDGHKELLTALGLSNDEEIRQLFSNLSSKLKAISGVTLNVANKVYVMEGGYDLHPVLKEDAVKVFDAAFETVDFGASADAVNKINTWVENKTNNKIKDLLTPDSVDAMTRLVLVNAIYFKGTWSKKFNPEFTSNQPFYGPKGEIEVPMMYREDKFKYSESDGLDAQLLELPYVGDEASMLIILPRERDGINGLLQKLASGYELASELANMHSMKVQVTIPKFKIETEIDLNSLLPKLGINKIFQQGGSDMTKILNAPEDLYVSKAIQKAFIEVNEEGAEAAAATGMVFMMRCAPMPAPEFRADRSFLYLLLTREQAPIFIGVYRGV